MFHADLKNPLTLLRTTVHGMDPMPGTDTAAFGARRHISGDLEFGEDGPDTCVVNGENDQILRLYAVEIRFVRDGESATLQVIDTLKGKQLAVLDGTGEVTKTHIGWRKRWKIKSIRVIKKSSRDCITHSVIRTNGRSAVATLARVSKTYVELGGRVARAGVIVLTNIGASLGTRPILGGTLVASYLTSQGSTSREFKEIARIRRITQVTVLTGEGTVGIWNGSNMTE